MRLPSTSIVRSNRRPHCWPPITLPRPTVDTMSVPRTWHLAGSGRRAPIVELYTRGSILDEVIPDLLRLQERYQLESYFADPSEPEHIERCRRAGVRITAATNDVIPGIDAVAASIKAGETVSPRCRGLLGELPDYTRRRDRSSGEAKEMPVEIRDDCCDAWRYAHMALDGGGGWGDFYRAEMSDCGRCAKEAGEA
jgi:hypothetical protein